MTDDPQDELRQRFEERSGPPESDQSVDSVKSSETVETVGTNESIESQQTDQSDESSDAARNRKQLAMLLPEEQRESLNKLYERINAKRTLEDLPQLEKNKDFYEEIADFVLEHEDELAERFDVDLD